MIFLILASTYDNCKQYLDTFLHICNEIGLPMAADKTVGPTTCLTFLGIELDTVSEVARLPDEKIQKCLGLLEEFLRRKRVTLKELQSLCGVLNFACDVIIPGRAFLRRLFDLCKGLRKPHHRIKLTRSIKDDLQIWKEFLMQFNGKCFFLEDKFVEADVLHLYTNASGSIGYGAVFGTAWFNGVWDET